MKCCFKFAVQLFCEFVIAPFLRDEEGRGGKSQKWHKADNNRPHEEFIMMFKVWGKEVDLVTKNDLWLRLATTEMAPDLRVHTAFWWQVKIRVPVSRVIHIFLDPLCLQRRGWGCLKLTRLSLGATPGDRNQRVLPQVSFSHSVVSESLWSHEPQGARPPCPSLIPGVHPNPCWLSRWCHPTTSSSVVSFSSCLQSFPASGYFQMS